MIRPQQRMLSRIASWGEYHPMANRRFNDLVVTRRSWAFWFVYGVASGWRPRLHGKES